MKRSGLAAIILILSAIAAIAVSPAGAQTIGPSTAPPGASSIVVTPPTQTAPPKRTARTEPSTPSVSTNSVLGTLHKAAGQLATHPGVAEAHRLAGKAFSSLGAYDGGIAQGQEPYQAAGRAVVSWGVGSTGGALIAGAICGTVTVMTAGVGCLLVLAAAPVVAGKLATVGYDYGVAWLDAKLNGSTGDRLNRADSSVLGGPCMDYNVIGQQAPCADGSFTPMQPMDMLSPLIGGGRAPEWTTIR